MRAIVVSRYPVCRAALGRLVGELSSPARIDGFMSLEEAVADAKQEPADLVVLDLSPRFPDLARIKDVVDAVAPAAVVLFAVLPQADIEAVRERGVKGCVPKTAPPELVLAALKLILAGGRYFGEIGEAAAKASSLRSRLSARQLEVLSLIEVGQTNKEIAKQLGISVATVKLHVQAILSVTGARNRTEAALRTGGQIR